MRVKEVFAELKNWSGTLPFNRTVQMTAEESRDPRSFSVKMTMSDVRFSWKISKTKRFLGNGKWNYCETNEASAGVLTTEEFESCEQAAARLRERVDAFVSGT